MDELYIKLRRHVYERLDIGRDVADSELYEVIDACIYDESRNNVISIRQKEELKQRLYNSIKKLDILQELLEDDSITEIMVNGSDSIFMERNGSIERWNKKFESENKLSDVAQRIAAMSNHMVNEASPIADTRLEDGSRVSIVLPPVAINGPIITIRKFFNKPITIDRLIELESITPEAAQFLEKLVKSKYNIFISGGTGSGKTTFLNVLSDYVPDDERVITIEDSAELQLHNINNIVRLEARVANSEGTNAVSIRDLIKASLRMRPDRIVVGEVRGPEAIDMLQAMNTGHDGSLSTGHANSPKDMLTRLETMVLMGMDMPVSAIRAQISSAIDIIVHLARLRDKSRKVVQIAEVGDCINGEIVLTPLFKFVENSQDKHGKVIGRLSGRITCLTERRSLKLQGLVNGNERYILEGIIIVLAAAYIFYENVLMSFILSPYVYIHYRQRIKERIVHDKKNFKKKFKDGIIAVSFALNVGYSIENAFGQAVDELTLMYGGDSDIVVKFKHIVIRLGQNENLEDILDDFAEESKVEDIMYFAEIFRYAKRSGGDLMAVIKNTAQIIQQKEEVMSEVDTIISGKKMEQRVMSLIPAVIVIYLKVTAKEFIQPLYGNIAGIIIMTVCLGVYVISDMWAKRIVNIEV